MGERHLARLWYRAAADQTRLRNSVMRRLEWTFNNEAGLARKPCDRVDLCDLEGLFKFEWRQDGRKAFGKHRLAGSGRSDKENVVPAGTCDL